MILSKNVFKDFGCTCYCFIYSEHVSLGQVSYLVVKILQTIDGYNISYVSEAFVAVVLDV